MFWKIESSVEIVLLEGGGGEWKPESHPGSVRCMGHTHIYICIVM